EPHSSLCDLNVKGLCQSSIWMFPYHRRKTLDSTHSRMPRPLGHFCAPCSRSLQKRPVRGRAFLLQPQRFGRNTWDSWNNKWLSPQAGDALSSPFWSLAAPQRFGKK
ncbi:FMRFamide-related peptide, partial [Pteropus alecto]